MLSKNLLDLSLISRQAGGQGDAGSLQIKTLYFIDKNGQTGTQEIMRALNLLKSNLTAITRSLCESGYLEKATGGADRRNVFFSITPEGKAFLSDALKKAEESVRRELSYTDCDKLDSLLSEATALLKN